MIVDQYLLLRFAHLIGLMLISAGLIGVFVADLRSRQIRDVVQFAQAVSFIGVFYDGLVVPGALLLLASGAWLIASNYGGWAFLNVPWLTGMVILFLFEFVEGNTITRGHFRKLRRLAIASAATGSVSDELSRVRAEQLASFTHFLDIPILFVIVSLGVLQPSDWGQFIFGLSLAIGAAAALTWAIPRLYPWIDQTP